MDRELEEDRAAELGYRTAGARELSLRDWMALQGDPNEAAPSPRAFEALTNRLRVKKWAKENPEKRRQIANRYYHKHGVPERQLALGKKRRWDRHRATAAVISCAECGVEFCCARPQRGGKPRKYCTVACMLRERYQRITPGARRVKRTGNQP